MTTKLPAKLTHIQYLVQNIIDMQLENGYSMEQIRLYIDQVVKSYLADQMNLGINRSDMSRKQMGSVEKIIELYLMQTDCKRQKLIILITECLEIEVAGLTEYAQIEQNRQQLYKYLKRQGDKQKHMRQYSRIQLEPLQSQNPEQQEFQQLVKLSELKLKALKQWDLGYQGNNPINTYDNGSENVNVNGNGNNYRGYNFNYNGGNDDDNDDREYGRIQANQSNQESLERARRLRSYLTQKFRESKTTNSEAVKFMQQFMF